MPARTFVVGVRLRDIACFVDECRPQTECEIGLDPALLSGQPSQGQTFNLERCERGIEHVRQRGTRPLVERCLQESGRVVVGACRQRGQPVAGQSLEMGDVDDVPNMIAEVQVISAACRRTSIPAVRSFERSVETWTCSVL